MKRITSILMAFIAIPFISVFAESNSTSSSEKIDMEITKTIHKPKPHRSPERIDLEASYITEGNIINVHYEGDASGEVFLYLNNEIVSYSDEIQTSFSISSSGLYRIEVRTEYWEAHGQIFILNLL